MSKYQEGLKRFNELTNNTAKNVLKNFDISPDYQKCVLEYAYADIHGRNILDKKTKSIASISAIIAQGYSEYLKVHINIALNIGVTKEEIMDVIILMTVYTGFPSASRAMSIAKEVFEERKK